MHLTACPGRPRAAASVRQTGSAAALPRTVANVHGSSDSHTTAIRSRPFLAPPIGRAGTMYPLRQRRRSPHYALRRLRRAGGGIRRHRGECPFDCAIGCTSKSSGEVTPIGAYNGGNMQFAETALLTIALLAPKILNYADVGLPAGCQEFETRGGTVGIGCTATECKEFDTHGGTVGMACTATRCTNFETRGGTLGMACTATECKEFDTRGGTVGMA